MNNNNKLSQPPQSGWMPSRTHPPSSLLTSTSNLPHPLSLTRPSTLQPHPVTNTGSSLSGSLPSSRLPLSMPPATNSMISTLSMPPATNNLANSLLSAFPGSSIMQSTIHGGVTRSTPNTQPLTAPQKQPHTSVSPYLPQPLAQNRLPPQTIYSHPSASHILPHGDQQLYVPHQQLQPAQPHLTIPRHLLNNHPTQPHTSLPCQQQAVSPQNHLINPGNSEKSHSLHYPSQYIHSSQHSTKVTPNELPQSHHLQQQHLQHHQYQQTQHELQQQRTEFQRKLAQQQQQLQSQPQQQLQFQSQLPVRTGPVPTLAQLQQQYQQQRQPLPMASGAYYLDQPAQLSSQDIPNGPIKLNSRVQHHQPQQPQTQDDVTLPGPKKRVLKPVPNPTTTATTRQRSAAAVTVSPPSKPAPKPPKPAATRTSKSKPEGIYHSSGLPPITPLSIVTQTDPGLTYESIGDYRLSQTTALLNDILRSYNYLCNQADKTNKNNHILGIDPGLMMQETAIARQPALLRIVEEPLASGSTPPPPTKSKRTGKAKANKSSAANVPRPLTSYNPFLKSSPSTPAAVPTMIDFQPAIKMHKNSLIQPRLYKYRKLLLEQLVTCLNDYDDVVRKYYTAVHKHHAIQNDRGEWERFWSEGGEKVGELTDKRGKLDQVFSVVHVELCKHMNFLTSEMARVGLNTFGIGAVELMYYHLACLHATQLFSPLPALPSPLILTVMYCMGELLAELPVSSLQCAYLPQEMRDIVSYASILYVPDNFATAEEKYAAFTNITTTTEADIPNNLDNVSFTETQSPQNIDLTQPLPCTTPPKVSSPVLSLRSIPLSTHTTSRTIASNFPNPNIPIALTNLIYSETDVAQMHDNYSNERLHAFYHYQHLLIANPLTHDITHILNSPPPQDSLRVETNMILSTFQPQEVAEDGQNALFSLYHAIHQFQKKGLSPTLLQQLYESEEKSSKAYELTIPAIIRDYYHQNVDTAFYKYLQAQHVATGTNEPFNCNHELTDSEIQLLNLAKYHYMLNLLRQRFEVTHAQFDAVKNIGLNGMALRRFKTTCMDFNKGLSVVFRLLRMYYAKKYNSTGKPAKTISSASFDDCDDIELEEDDTNDPLYIDEQTKKRPRNEETTTTVSFSTPTFVPTPTNQSCEDQPSEHTAVRKLQKTSEQHQIHFMAPVQYHNLVTLRQHSDNQP